jgi:hypothetical protein
MTVEMNGRQSAPSTPGEAVRRAELERFPATTVVVLGILISLIGVFIGISTAAGGIKQRDGAGLAIVLAFLVFMLMLVLAGRAVRAVEDWRIEQLRAAAHNEQP